MRNSKTTKSNTRSEAVFDAAYYTRYYEDPATRAVSQVEQERQARFIAAYLHYLDLEISSILDVGCGIGTLLNCVRDSVQDCINGHAEPTKETADKPTAKKVVSATGMEVSDYLCEKYGWIHCSVLDYEGPGADLVICNDVLGYLGKRDARNAIKKLAGLSARALYFSVITLDDLDICDQEHTDMTQKLRPADWYQAELARHYMNVGGGLYLKKPVSVPVWRLERA